MSEKYFDHMATEPSDDWRGRWWTCAACGCKCQRFDDVPPDRCRDCGMSPFPAEEAT